MSKTLHLILLLFGMPAIAVDTGQAFADPELQARYDNIIEEVRCLKCQNQNIKDSNAFLAVDLRREIRVMIGEGKSDDEIFDFLVSRYGDFALYRPRASGKTLVLWIAPFAFLLLGGFVLFGIFRRHLAQPGDLAANDQD